MSGKSKPASKPEDLENLSKEELITRVTQLEAHVLQLKNILAKHLSDSSDRTSINDGRKKQRVFDFKRYNKRHVLLKVCYLGWDYQGLVVQEDTLKTIEAEVFNAMLRTRLIENVETANYHRCGRTDKGVSAFGQVISLDLRSNLLEGPGVIVADGSLASERVGCKTVEINYSDILNRVLPPEIRIISWAPVSADFSARFNCSQRTYKYYFPRGELNIQLMREASKQFIGVHDFRNFCKMDVANGVVNFVRHITSFDINKLSENDDEDPYGLYELVVVGKAFLWHQIRSLAAVLFLIGQGLEKSDVIPQLLDVQTNPCKPQYGMALPLPLVLFDCQYDETVKWEIDNDAHTAVIRHLQQIWCQHAVRSTIVRQMLLNLEEYPANSESLEDRKKRGFKRLKN